MNKVLHVSEIADGPIIDPRSGEVNLMALLSRRQKCEEMLKNRPAFEIRHDCIQSGQLCHPTPKNATGGTAGGKNGMF